MSPTRKPIYLDHAATTAVDPRVVEAMLPYFTSVYGNASSVHSFGREAHQALEQARGTVASFFQADPDEIIFTGCGTESDNLAIRGVTHALRSKGNHLITSTIEHHAVSHTCEQLQKHFGCEVTYVPVDSQGLVDPADVARAITPRTVLISIMYANNEMGAIQPIAEIGRIARAKGVAFHTDAVQAGGTLSLDADALNLDLASLSAHKFYGPKGVGVLYRRKGTPILPTQAGGAHERGLRAGTENVPYIVGLAKAMTIAYEHCEHNNNRIRSLRDKLIQGVLQAIPQTTLTGHPTQRLPNNASFVFEGVEGESILLNLDLLGIAGSSGSACTSGSVEPSHVLTAMRLAPILCHGRLRLTLGNENTAEDIDYVLSVLPGIIHKLRTLSPSYNEPPSVGR